MSKKKVVKTKPKGKAPAKKQSKKDIEKVLKSGAIRRRVPKDVALPGMETVRIPALDKIAGSLADVRANKNDLNVTEKALLGNALALMKQHERKFWKAHGIELIRVTGDDKVRARLVADDNTEGGDEGDEDVIAEDAVTGEELEA